MAILKTKESQGQKRDLGKETGGRRENGNP